MNKFSVYLVTNKINGKLYVGQTSKPVEARWKGHVNPHKGAVSALHRAIQKYGVDNFTIELIETTDTLEQVRELEKYWIALHKSNDSEFGYNLTPVS